MALLLKALAIFAAAGVLAVEAKKTYVFNAFKCNTNFDLDQNWANLDKKANPDLALVTPLVTEAKDKNPLVGYPALVEFADASEQTLPVEVLLPAETYRMKTLRFSNKMKMTFAADGAQLTFDAAANRAAATFTSGQTSSNPACSLGCHKNFWEYEGRKPEEAVEMYDALKEINEEGLESQRGSDPDFVAAEEAPCNQDTVVLPRGFGYNVLALGFHAYKGVVFAGPGTSVVAAKSEAELPPFFTWPNKQQKLFVGKDVAETCKAYGHSETDRRGNLQCICTSECPANQDDAVLQASALRNATKLHAQYRLKGLARVSKFTTKDYEFEFGNAFKLSQAKGTYQACKVDGATAGKLVGAYFNNMLTSSEVTAKVMPGNRIKVSGKIKNFAAEVVDVLALKFDGAIRVLDDAAAPGFGTCDADEVKRMQAETVSSKCAGLFNATVHAKFGGAINEESDEACECLLAMPLKAGSGLFEGIDGLCKTHGSAHTVADVLAQCQAKAAGGATALIDVRNTPEAALAMHVYHAVVESMACLDDKQTAGLVAAAGLKEEKEATVHVYGGANLPQMDVYRLVDGNNVDGVVDHVYEGLGVKSGFKLGFTKVSKQDMRANWKITSPGDRVVGKNAVTTKEAHINARYGLATQLVDVQITYSGWTTGAGPNVELLERVVNYLLATYELQSHHKCFEFATGYNQDCIDQLVYDAIAEDLGKDECGFGKYESCRERATKLAVKAIIAIKKCGLLGTVQIQVGRKTIEKCADRVEEQRVFALATNLANNTVSLQVASLMTAHSSSVHAHSSSVGAVSATQEARYATWLNNRSDALTKRLADLNVAVAAAVADAIAFAANAKGADLDEAEPKPEMEAVSKLFADKLAEMQQQYLSNEKAKFKAAINMTECNATRFNYYVPYEDPEYCADEELDVWRTEDATAVAKNALDQLQKERVQFLSDAAVEEGVTEEQKEELLNQIEQFKAALEEIKVSERKAERELAMKMFDLEDAGCTMEDTSRACRAQVLEIVQLQIQLEKMQKQRKEYEAFITKSEKVVASAEPPKDDKEEGLPIMYIIIGAAAIIVICLLCVAIVLFAGGSSQSTNAKTNGNGRGGPQRGSFNRGGPQRGSMGGGGAAHASMAFENPMYDNGPAVANPMYNDAPGADMYGEVAGTSMYAEAYDQPTLTAQVEENDGLYDQPAFAPDDIVGGSGYLDVQADSEDDEEDDEEDDSDDDETDDE